MPYLLSLLGSDAVIAGSKHRLCCYINNTTHIQLIREVNEAGVCLFTRVMFAGERVLFTALPGAALEIRTPLHASASLQRVDCSRLCLHAAPRAAPVAVAFTTPATVGVTVS